MQVLRSLRLTEYFLLTTGGLATLLALSMVSIVTARQVTLAALLPGALVLAGLAAVHVWFVASRFRGDQLLLGIVTLLSGIGLAVVTRLDATLAARQMIWILVGLATMVGVLAFPRPVVWLKRYKYTFAVLGLLLVMATLVVGKDPNESGARLWLSLGGVMFQPSELLKVLLAIFLAAYLDDKRELLSAGVYRIGPLRLPPVPYLGPLLLMWGLSVVVLLGQRDLGPAFLLFGVFLAMLYVASSRLVYAWGGLVMFGVAFVLTALLIRHAAVRVEIWWNPWADPQGKAYQLVQSLVAMANGGVLGTGLGLGRPDLIPAVYTDFPFAALAEETGMAGVLALLGIYLALTYRGFHIALETREGFQQMLVVGLTTVLGLQTLIIVGGNVRMIPLTGITLPFISYGGSSLLVNFLIVGLLLRISHENRKEERTR